LESSRRPAVPEVDIALKRWRGIDELASLIGAYCWVEHRIFELSGIWATGTSDGPWGGLEPAERVWCAGVSRRHGLLAACWAERLPVRAGVDRGALVAAPSGPLAVGLDALAAASDPRIGLAALVEALLPRLQGVYGLHQQTASPVSEASVLEVLTGAHLGLGAEIRGGRDLLEGSVDGLTRDAALGRRIERAFDETDVFPAVHAS
jgi:hypothetical protein